MTFLTQIPKTYWVKLRMKTVRKDTLLSNVNLGELFHCKMYCKTFISNWLEVTTS